MCEVVLNFVLAILRHRDCKEGLKGSRVKSPDRSNPFSKMGY